MISLAYAAETAGAAADPTAGLVQMLPLILMFVVLWFLMIRPQMKKAKEHKALLEAIAKGDEVVTQGGIAGRVAKLNDNNYVTLEVAIAKDAPVEILVQKAAITLVLPKGTLKSL